MEILQLEVFEYGAGSDGEFLTAAQEHFGATRLIVDKVTTDDETKYYAYAADQVNSLVNQVVSYVVNRLDPRARVFITPDRDYREFSVEIKTRNTGFFVGHHGHTFDALELIIGVMLNRHFVLNRSVALDVDGYRERRESALIKAAKEVIREIEKDHKPRPIPDLLPKERKIIHKFLSNHPYLTSMSQGKGRDRTLYIAPKSFSGSMPENNNDEG